jgi:hypothetical protein
MLMLGVYEMTRVDLLAGVFVWAYEGPLANTLRCVNVFLIPTLYVSVTRNESTVR